jgi:sterol desaturase/sphingolipid hydroxylase (fatty acid hydroxylase superfamily)
MSREIAVRIVSFLAVSMAMAVWEFAGARLPRIVVIPRETNSNFGFNLPWWDRIGGTYRDQPGNQPAGIRKEVADEPEDASRL